MQVIFDIDGTLSDPTHRLRFITEQEPKDWDAFYAACGDDAPINEALDVLAVLDAEHKVILATGRVESTRETTLEWFARHRIYADEMPLYMRKDGDHRPDTVVKREMLDQMRADGWEPTLAIEDRASVVAMWREAGLLCWQVAEGNF